MLKKELENELEIAKFATKSVQESLDRAVETLKKERVAFGLLEAKVQELAVAADKVLNLEKQLADSKKQHDYYYEACQELHTAIDQVHDVLDAVGCPVPKKAESAYTDMPISVRVAAMMTILPRLPQPKES